MVHELGHFLCACFFHVPIDKIYIYPFGGVSKFQSKVNIPLKIELWILCMGPLVQVIFALLFYPVLPEHSQSMFLFYHFNILVFNLLPIYPLDGGRILNIFFSYHLSYQKSFTASYIFAIIVLVFFFLLLLQNRKLNLFFIFCFLLVKVYEEWRKRKFYQEKFLLERYLEPFHFKKRCQVSSLNEFRRDYHHVIKGKRRYYSEREALNKKFNGQHKIR